MPPVSSIDEKRVYAGEGDGVTAYVASDTGLVAVSVAGDRVGSFRVADRRPARDVAALDRPAVDVAVASDDDVRVVGDESYESGFGPAVAVGADGERMLAADADGRIERCDGDGWHPVGRLGAGTVRALDGDLTAASGGVHRLAPGLPTVGLDDARAVSTAGPYAATGDCLYRLGNGWHRVLEGEATAVAAGDAGALAVVDGELYRTDRTADGGTAADWRAAAPPAGEVVAAAVDPAFYAVTADGTFLVDAGDGWRTQSLGVEPRAVAVVP